MQATMMRTMTPMITQSEAPACPPASLPKTAAEALAVVVVLLKRGLLVVDGVVVASSIGGLNGGFFVDGFGSDSVIDRMIWEQAPVQKETFTKA